MNTYSRKGYVADANSSLLWWTLSQAEREDYNDPAINRDMC